MHLHKTARALAELKPGVRTLGQRERNLLLLADGTKSLNDFAPLFDGEGGNIALKLLKDGFLVACDPPEKAPSFVDSRLSPLSENDSRSFMDTQAKTLKNASALRRLADSLSTPITLSKFGNSKPQPLPSAHPPLTPIDPPFSHTFAPTEPAQFLSDNEPYLSEQAPVDSQFKAFDGNQAEPSKASPEPSKTTSLTVSIFDFDLPPPLQRSAPLPRAAASMDIFGGKRSLDSTRCYLLDLCERIFALCDPALADGLSEAVNSATDRESMLTASRALIAQIENAVGAKRADEITLRIAMLLPID